MVALSGCASRSARENLRNCRWDVAGISMDAAASGLYRGSAQVRFENPTKNKAVLDSLWLDISTPGGPLAHLSHGGTLEILPGAHDSTDIHFQAVPAQLGMRMMEMLFAAPDSLTLRGEARFPVMGGLFHSRQSFQAKVPGNFAATLLGQMLPRKAGESLAPEASPDDSDLVPDDEDDDSGSLQEL